MFDSVISSWKTITFLWVIIGVCLCLGFTSIGFSKFLELKILSYVGYGFIFIAVSILLGMII